MRTRSSPCFPAALALALAGLLPESSPGQGLLAPAGSPTPTMRTLDQVEPRVLVNAANTPGNAANTFVISQSGSYLLGADVIGASGRNGIMITTDDVTIDLNGFSVNGTAGALIGITTNTAHRGVRIHGGRVSDWPAAGIVITGAGTTVSDVTVINSGAAIVLDQTNATRIFRCSASGINVSGSLTTCLSADSVENCTLQNISSTGTLTGVVAGTQASNCALQTLSGTTVTGISGGGQVLDSAVIIVTGTSITGITGSRISRCQATGMGNGSTTTLIGISGSFVSECYTSGLNQGGASSTLSAAISAFNCVNCGVLNASFNSSSVTPGIRASLQAIGCSVVNVHNGGTGAAVGISLSFFSNSTGQVSQCRVDNCEAGILTVDRCQVFNCTVAGCDGTGIQVGQRCSVIDCTVTGNGLITTSPGISTDIRSQVMRCNSNENSGDGIAIPGGCRVEGCTAENSTLGSGIHVVSGAGCRIEGNHVRDNHRYGIEATTGDIIARNTAGGNVIASYLPSSGNNFGPVQFPATATNPAANF